MQLLKGLSVVVLTTLAISASFSVFAEDQDSSPDPPGEYDVCWVGNTFSGSGGFNGFGYWVQQGADEIEIAPNGMVAAGCGWDEAGRCVGLYKDNKVNRVLLKQEDVHETAWGWNTGSNAIALFGSNIYIGNTGKWLVRFEGDVDDLDSWTWKAEVELSDEPIGASANAKYVVFAYPQKLEILNASDLKVVASWNLKTDKLIRDVLIDDSDRLFLIVDETIQFLNFKNGKFSEQKSGAFPNLAKPAALALDWQDRKTLIVCDNGPDRQVKFYDVSQTTAPKLLKTFGEKGGLFSKTKVDGKLLPDGVNYPTRFHALRGAGCDKNGNLYVALGFNEGPCGSFMLRAFSPQGKLLWEHMNLAFVDTFGFDPDSDGAKIYTRTSILELNPDSPKADLNWRNVATTIDDRYSEEEDQRPSRGCSAFFKTLQGHKLFYTIGQYATGIRFYSFDEASGSQIARPVGKIIADEESWAWFIDDRGDLWRGDYHPSRSIRRYKFTGWKKVDDPENKGLYAPQYDLENPYDEPWPEDFDDVRRLVYDAPNDAMYLCGYLKTDEVDSWGVCGKTLRKYEHWSTKERKIAWTIATPVNPKGENGKPLTPEGFAFAGDYLFFGMVKPDGSEQRTYVLDAHTGKNLGAFKANGEEVNTASWHDMPYSVSALKRKNGVYLIMTEEDWRGKNIVYRWKPKKD